MRLAGLILLLMLASCARDKFEPDWLLGHHQFVESDSLIINEEWEKKSEHLYHCSGYTVSGEERIFNESINLSNSTGEWTYTVIGVHEKPMDFIVDQYDSVSFSCHNDTNNFPKRITYLKTEAGYEVTLHNEIDTVRMLFQ